MKYQLWSLVENYLATKLSKEVMSYWFDNLIEVEKKEDKLFITVFRHVQAEWMDQQYTEIIEDAIEKVLEKKLFVYYIVTDPSEEGAPYVFKENQPKERMGSNSRLNSADINDVIPQPKKQESRFNPKYTFENFVVGSHNRFAHAASLAVSEMPAQTYNPLFIYGDSGLGKTHLIHAIAHRTEELFPNTKIIYVSTEAFTNDFISSVRSGRAAQFKNRYRNADIFLIDDIQFLSGKDGTQEEFFHTFNALHEQGKQIVISSDRPPRAISTLEDRLKSRFEGGLITDISKPDLETRIAILQYKAAEVAITEDSLYYIASNVDSSIRELEGALTRVIYYANVEQVAEIDLDLTKEALQGVIKTITAPVPTPERIKQIVSNYFQVSIADLSSKKRSSAISKPRHIAMYLCREMLDRTLPTIGLEFGGRDHSTVIYACENIQRQIELDPTTRKIVEDLKKQILS